MIVAFDWETSKKPHMLAFDPKAFAVCLSMYSDEFGKKTWFFNHEASTKSPAECIDEIQDIFNKSELNIAYNAKFDLQWCRKYNIYVPNVYCAMVGEYTKLGHVTKVEGLPLKHVADTYCLPSKLDKVAEFWEAGYETNEIDAALLQEYCEHDAYLAYKIGLSQAEYFKAQGVWPLIQNEMEFTQILADMEYEGALIDIEQLSVLRDQLQERLDILDTKLVEYLGIENISSSDQLSCALFGGSYLIDGRVPGKKEGTTKNGKIPCAVTGLGFKPINGTETKKQGIYSVSKDVINEIKARTEQQKEVKELLLERSAVDQILKTYCVGLMKVVYEDNMLHCNFNQALTKTSRLSCSGPNLQNIPSRDTSIKERFISRY